MMWISRIMELLLQEKGGNQMVVYFGSEVADALHNYMDGDRKSCYSPLRP